MQKTAFWRINVFPTTSWKRKAMTGTLVVAVMGLPSIQTAGTVSTVAGDVRLIAKREYVELLSN
jgi:hypothetical protein